MQKALTLAVIVCLWGRLFNLLLLPVTCSFRQAWPPLKVWSGTTSGTGSCQENLVHPVTFGFSDQLIFSKFKIAITTQDRLEGELKLSQ